MIGRPRLRPGVTAALDEFLANPSGVAPLRERLEELLEVPSSRRKVEDAHQLLTELVRDGEVSSGYAALHTILNYVALIDSGDDPSGLRPAEECVSVPISVLRIIAEGFDRSLADPIANDFREFAGLKGVKNKHAAAHHRAEERKSRAIAIAVEVRIWQGMSENAARAAVCNLEIDGVDERSMKTVKRAHSERRKAEIRAEALRQGLIVGEGHENDCS